MTDLIRRDLVAVLNDLPEVCFSRLNTTGEPITLRCSHVGYSPTRQAERKEAAPPFLAGPC
jgi:hypothetical protein